MFLEAPISDFNRHQLHVQNLAQHYYTQGIKHRDVQSKKIWNKVAISKNILFKKYLSRL